MTVAASPSRNGRVRWLGPTLLAAWLVVMCFAPDPHPLGAPEWVVAAIRASTGIGEPAARVAATLGLRGLGLALLGALFVVVAGAKRLDRRSAAALVLAPLLAIGTRWVNLGYFPIALQIQVAVLSTMIGAIVGLALSRNPVAAVGMLIAVGGVFAWGTATGISDELHSAARAVGGHVLASRHEIPDGDAGFARLIEIAFDSAEANSGGADPVLANQAAIVALAVILGEERIAEVASRHVDPSRIPEARALRERITLYGRADWPQHFWVSAGLSVLSDADRSIAVGLTKELMDATPGGSGFSFSDLTADAAGNRFALAATRDAESARALQARIRAGVRIDDYFPDVRDLPEGMTQEEFQERYGGLGSEETKRVVDEIQRRLEACSGLR